MDLKRMKRAVKLTKAVSTEPETGAVQEIEESVDDEINREAENLIEEVENSEPPDLGIPSDTLFTSTDDESDDSEDEDPQTTIPEYSSSRNWYTPTRQFTVSDSSIWDNLVDPEELSRMADPDEDDE